MVDNDYDAEEARYNTYNTNIPIDVPPPMNGSFGVPINSQAPAGTMDLSYWQSRHDEGLPNAPGVNDMFDTQTGQLRPGYTRTARGYEYAPVSQAPQAQPTYGGGGGNYALPGQGGGGWGYLTEPFTGRPPAWQMGPSFNAPSFTPPPPFSYKSFEAPTKDSMYADPSYQFRLGEGQKALEQSAAGRGVLRTGGSLKDLTNYGQNAASQEYANIFGRAVDAHNLGLQQELGTYATNYGVSRDTYDRLFEESKAEFAPQQRNNEMMNQREFDNFLADFDIFEKSRRRAGDYLFQGANMGG